MRKSAKDPFSVVAVEVSISYDIPPPKLVDDQTNRAQFGGRDYTSSEG
jgi:hypothetical protein